jgi:peptidoglycan-N-acetylglucosamine deacetylase
MSVFLRLRARWFLFACLLFCQGYSLAAGPAVVAKVDVTLWPEPINTPAGFDAASRAAILVYVDVLTQFAKRSDSDLQAAFKIKSFNRVSLDRWLKSELALSQKNYDFAAADCTKPAAATWSCAKSDSTADGFAKTATATLENTPDALQFWHLNFREFTNQYLAEQLRLAALFPSITSEIATFGTQEWMGDGLADRQFYLSFDDGPTAKQGNTDKTLAMLKRSNKSAVFFLLGENLEQRIHASDAAQLKVLYQGQCLASHGWQHRSHASWADWQSSVQRTHSLLGQTFATPLPLFRPPYGQRRADSKAFFAARQLHVALWNIDSQDWNAQVNAQDVAARVQTLMLIKRHGVLLFHDIHPKANVALPQLFATLGNAVQWGECQDTASF